MRTQVFFWKFETKKVPGKIVAQGVRFELVELPADKFDETKYSILCDAHPELKHFDLASFKKAVAHNFQLD